MFEAVTMFYKLLPEELKQMLREADPEQAKDLENMMYIDDNNVMDQAVMEKMIDDVQRGLDAIPIIFGSADKYKNIKHITDLSNEQRTEFMNECKEQINALVVMHKISVEFGKIADKWIPTKDQKEVIADFIRKHKDEIMKEDKDEKED